MGTENSPPKSYRAFLCISGGFPDEGLARQLVIDRMQSIGFEIDNNMSPQESIRCYF